MIAANKTLLEQNQNSGKQFNLTKFKIMYVCSLCPLLFPYSGTRSKASTFKCKIDQDDFTGCILLSNLMKETSPNSKALSTNI